MLDFSIGEMQEMQRILQEKYKDKWEPVNPETGKNKLLWMISAFGEVIAIIQKNGHEKAFTFYFLFPLYHLFFIHINILSHLFYILIHMVYPAGTLALQ